MRMTNLCPLLLQRKCFVSKKAILPCTDLLQYSSYVVSSMLPMARVLYCSATGVSDVKNMVNLVKLDLSVCTLIKGSI